MRQWALRRELLARKVVREGVFREREIGGESEWGSTEVCAAHIFAVSHRDTQRGKIIGLWVLDEGWHGMGEGKWWFTKLTMEVCREV